MNEESMATAKQWKNKCSPSCGGPAGAVYGLGFIGAVVYYIQTSGEFFWAGVIGILKAIVWPAFVIYELMRFLGM